MVDAGKIVTFLVGLLVVGLLLPIGLASILEFTSTDSTVETIVTILFPILIVVGIVTALIKSGGND